MIRRESRMIGDATRDASRQATRRGRAGETALKRNRWVKPAPFKVNRMPRPALVILVTLTTITSHEKEVRMRVSTCSPYFTPGVPRISWSALAFDRDTAKCLCRPEAGRVLRKTACREIYDERNILVGVGGPINGSMRHCAVVGRVTVFVRASCVLEDGTERIVLAHTAIHNTYTVNTDVQPLDQ